ncbi:MAG: hypothetical protein IJT86_06510 [Spirochaetales bacterium]|nr:hypothetical protein [Spirochaetales bacterium]MBQ4501232.1 hypothetical protein [Spirochaetales bacterium]MBQ7729994.1 hypothetical protein [Spirochaetales bacterium]
MDKKEIIRILNDTSSELEGILDLPASPSDEVLQVKTMRGKTCYFAYSKKSGKQVYVRKTDKDTLTCLATRYYESKLKAAALKEKHQIDRCLDILSKDPESTDITKVSEKIPKEIKSNVRFSELTGEGYARKWQQGNRIVKKYRSHKEDDYHKFKTLRGDYVGSKSELIIADRLFVKGIPYHYEVAFTPEAEIDASRPVYDQFGFIAGYEVVGFSPFDQDTLHPDFYVLNKRTRKAYFWEHLGKMDDPAYCQKNFNRFMRILDAGYIIGEDLIVTHEDSRHPLMTEDIDRIIEKYLT